MAYVLLADATMVLHFAVLLYIVFGGFLAWRWRWTIGLHVVMVTWGVLIVLAVVDCPLTSLEDWARRSGGEQGLDRGFIDTYLTGVIYPADRVVLVRVLAGTVIAVSWAGLVLLIHRSRRARLSHRPVASPSQQAPGDPAAGR